MLKNKEGFSASGNLTKWVRYVLYAQIVVAVVSIASGSAEYELLSSVQNGTYTSEAQVIADAEANDQRQRIIGLVYLSVFVISGFLILRWIHRANSNVKQLGAKNMAFTPGWSIGYYFIPILCLWKPYQAMKEIWKASKDPSDWESQDISGVLPLWWAVWLISNFLGQAIFRISERAEELEELMNINLIYRISDVLDIVLALVFLTIVNRIYSFQTRHLESANIHMQPTAEGAV
ncbi:DUF4328 domain-containing protein [Kangiella sp. M94]